MLTGSETKRAKLRLTVHRGFDGNRPTRLSATHPVKTGEVITSGMIISIVRNTTKLTNEWIRGYVPGTSLPNTFYVAFDDGADGDARAAGNLQGLSVRGDYDLSTAAVKSGETYVVGDELTFDAVTGDFKKAVATNIVIGVVVRDYAAPVNLGATYVPFDSTALVSDGVLGGKFTIARHSNATNLTRVRLETVSPYVKA